MFNAELYAKNAELQAEIQQLKAKNDYNYNEVSTRIEFIVEDQNNKIEALSDFFDIDLVKATRVYFRPSPGKIEDGGYKVEKRKKQPVCIKDRMIKWLYLSPGNNYSFYDLFKIADRLPQSRWNDFRIYFFDDMIKELDKTK